MLFSENESETSTSICESETFSPISESETDPFNDLNEIVVMSFTTLHLTSSTWSVTKCHTIFGKLWLTAVRLRGQNTVCCDSSDYYYY